MRKIQKLAVVSAMTIVLGVSPNGVRIEAAQTKLSKDVGIVRYQVPVSLWHATKDQESMAGSAIRSQAIIEAREERTIVYIYSEAMSMEGITANLQHLYIKSDDGTVIEAVIESYKEDGTPECFSFEVDSLQEFIDVKVDADIMLADARLKFNLEEMREETFEEEQQQTVQEIPIAIWHATQDQASMMNVCVAPTARVVSENERYRIYFYTTVLTMGNISGYVTGLQVVDTNGEVSVAEIEKTDKDGIATCFSVKLSELSQYHDAIVNAEVPIPGMSEMNIRIKFDLDSITLVEEDIDVTVSKEEAEAEDSEEEMEEEEQDKPVIDDVTSATRNEEETTGQDGSDSQGGSMNQGGSSNQNGTVNQEGSSGQDDFTGSTGTQDKIDTNTDQEESGQNSQGQNNQTQSQETQSQDETQTQGGMEEELKAETEDALESNKEVVIPETESTVAEVPAEENQTLENADVSTQDEEHEITSTNQSISYSSLLVRVTAGVSAVTLAGLYIFEAVWNKKKQNKGKK